MSATAALSDPQTFTSLAVVGPTPDGASTAIWHVQLVQVGDSNVTVKAGDLTGAWVLQNGDPAVAGLTEDRLMSDFGVVTSTSPADLLEAIQQEISEIQRAFDAVQDARPKKRNGQPKSPLVSPAWPDLPSREQIVAGGPGDQGGWVPEGDNEQVRAVLMRALLFSVLLRAWSQVEGERTARKALRGDQPLARAFPPGWPK